MIQCDKTKKKHKFLRHIPLNSDIKFATLDLKNLLSADKYRLFEEEVSVVG